MSRAWNMQYRQYMDVESTGTNQDKLDLIRELLRVPNPSFGQRKILQSLLKEQTENGDK